MRGRVQVKQDEAKVICESAVDYQSWIEDKGEEEESREEAASSPNCEVHITIPRSGDQEEDVRLLGEIHALLTSQRGQDRFSLYVRRGDTLVQLIFPNDTTSYSPALKKAVTGLLGEGCLRVETVERS